MQVNNRSSIDHSHNSAEPLDTRQRKFSFSTTASDSGYSNTTCLNLRSNFSLSSLKPITAKVRALFSASEKPAQAGQNEPKSAERSKPRRLQKNHPLENPRQPPHPRLGHISDPYSPRTTAFVNSAQISPSAFENPRPAPEPPGKLTVAPMQSAQEWANDALNAIYGRE